MAEQADADDLMRQYLDLWQDQMSALAADQDFARAMQQVMTGMGLTGAATPAAWAGLMAGLAPKMPEPVTQGDASTDGQGRDAKPSGRSRTPGAAASRAASGGGGADVDKLTRRLAALEKRIAALEGGPAPKRRRAASKPRKA